MRINYLRADVILPCNRAGYLCFGKDTNLFLWSCRAGRKLLKNKLFELLLISASYSKHLGILCIFNSLLFLFLKFKNYCKMCVPSELGSVAEWLASFVLLFTWAIMLLSELKVRISVIPNGPGCRKHLLLVYVSESVMEYIKNFFEAGSLF